MPLYRNGRKIILFVHIPKTGGSTVEEVLKAAGAAQALKFHKRLGFSNSTPQHMTWDVTRQWIPRDFYNSAFTVVRHPLARIVSEYHWRQKVSKVTLPPFDIWVHKQFDLHADNPYLLDNHIRPQTDFVGPPVKIFRLEDGLEAPVRVGLRRLGLADAEVPIHHARKSKIKDMVVTPKTLATIKAFYQSDYDAFDYTEDVPLPPGLVLTSDPSAATSTQ